MEKMSSRFKTKKEFSKDYRCQVFLIVSYDSTSYYIKFGYGKGTCGFHLLCNFNENVSNTSNLTNDKQNSIVRLC